MKKEKVKDREKVKELVKEVLDKIEISSHPILKRVSESDVANKALFYFLNILVFLQSCGPCEKAKKVRGLIGS